MYYLAQYREANLGSLLLAGHWCLKLRDFASSTASNTYLNRFYSWDYAAIGLSCPGWIGLFTGNSQHYSGLQEARGKKRDDSQAQPLARLFWGVWVEPCQEAQWTAPTHLHCLQVASMTGVRLLGARGTGCCLVLQKCCYLPRYSSVPAGLASVASLFFSVETYKHVHDFCPLLSVTFDKSYLSLSTCFPTFSLSSMFFLQSLSCTVWELLIYWLHSFFSFRGTKLFL